MLVKSVERNRENSAGFPFKRELLALVVPHARRAATLQHQHHFFKQLALGLKLSAGRNLAHIAIVGGARGLVVDEHALAAATRPGLQIHRTQVGHIMPADDVQPFGLHPALVRRTFFGGELFGQLIGNKRRESHCALSCRSFRSFN